MELTILMPCLNEEKTLAACIEAAKDYLKQNQCEGEILIADNGSRDQSIRIAVSHGARVEVCHAKGYGNVLRFGLQQAKGEIIIFGDCDCSYDFRQIGLMHHMLSERFDMVIGDRFVRRPMRGAMSISHRLGVPFLSFLARKRYQCEIRDFHCGLRGVRREALEHLRFSAEGMEFATEFIAEGCRAGLRIGQTPVTLYPDGRDGRSHLRTVQDGIRHLRYICRRI